MNIKKLLMILYYVDLGNYVIDDRTKLVYACMPLYDI